MTDEEKFSKHQQKAIILLGMYYFNNEDYENLFFNHCVNY